MGKWSRTEKITLWSVLVAIIGIIVGVINPEIRETFVEPFFSDDDPKTKPTPPSPPINTNGEFIDKRDGKKYKWVKIGNQIWMVENLAYEPKTSDGYYGYRYWKEGSNNSEKNKWFSIYEDNDQNLQTYGLLYTWEAVMNDERSDSNVCGICPEEWHIPTDDDWKQLELALGMPQSELNKIYYRGTTEGAKLKSISGWSRQGNGTNESGFSALPMGYRHYIDGRFYNIRNYATFWSSTEVSNDQAWARYLSYENSQINRYYDSKKSAFAVRCVKDN